MEDYNQEEHHSAEDLLPPEATQTNMEEEQSYHDQTMEDHNQEEHQSAEDLLPSEATQTDMAKKRSDLIQTKKVQLYLQQTAGNKGYR